MNKIRKLRMQKLKEQKELYVRKIAEAFNRMGFYIDLFGKTKLPEMYELFLYNFENPPKQGFDILTSVNFQGITLEIEQIEFEDNYF